MSERLKVPVSKTGVAVFRHRGFESHPLRSLFSGHFLGSRNNRRINDLHICLKPPTITKVVDVKTFVKTGRVARLAVGEQRHAKNQDRGPDGGQGADP